ncbi:hypothetical protein [Aureimonas glaciei]|jgi:hypothetical protein|uniref:STAS domain-containing protein n=1 Tax=Aureimonas glaciei TaxID=1776957 RepID=A0A916XTE4_9HYPH|nr:hypothetical protein [Aureimonas glaciei]GGD08790.1 hypothetical protein GCM10011335_09570 [Aureimonas glaciei]
MTIRLEDPVIHLEGSCHVEEAETLLTLLQAKNERILDLSACDHLHAALVQVILALRPPVRDSCSDAFLRRWVLPGLLRADSQAR